MCTSQSQEVNPDVKEPCITTWHAMQLQIKKERVRQSLSLYPPPLTPHMWFLLVTIVKI